MVNTFASTARERIRIDSGYRRDHLCALAQYVEVADREVRARAQGARKNLLRPQFSHRRAVASELVSLVAGADAEHGAAARHLVQDGDFLSDADRVIEREH